MEDTQTVAEPDPQDDRGRGLLFFIVLAIIVLFVGWFLLNYFDADSTGTGDGEITHTAIVFVPDVVGLSESEAVGVLEAAGFGVESMPLRDEYATPDSVLVQSPTAGTETVTGITVTIEIASAFVLEGGSTEASEADDATRAVPDVIGRSQEAAESVLDSNGFQVVVTKAYDAQAPSGKVVAQSPSAGARLTWGEQVGIVVSLGKAPASAVYVPCVFGMSESVACATVEARDLELYVVPRPSPPATLDLVWEQWPVTGTLVERGTRVTVIIGID